MIKQAKKDNSVRLLDYCDDLLCSRIHSGVMREMMDHIYTSILIATWHNIFCKHQIVTAWNCLHGWTIVIVYPMFCEYRCRSVSMLLTFAPICPSYWLVSFPALAIKTSVVVAALGITATTGPATGTLVHVWAPTQSSLGLVHLSTCTTLWKRSRSETSHSFHRDVHL